jgi:hypothetical protein
VERYLEEATLYEVDFPETDHELIRQGFVDRRILDSLSLSLNGACVQATIFATFYARRNARCTYKNSSGMICTAGGARQTSRTANTGKCKPQ